MGSLPISWGTRFFEISDVGSNPQLPLNCTNIENIQKIDNFIGSLIYYEDDAQFICIKVHVDVTKALNLGLYIKRQ